MVNPSQQCPYCYSWHVITKNTARQVGATLGATGGAVHGMSGAWAGARAGTALGTRMGVVAGPVGASLGSIAGAVLGAILGASTFGFVGAKLGELVDNTVLDNHHCLDCGQSFNITRFIAEIPLLETSAISGVSGISHFDAQMIDERIDNNTLDDPIKECSDIEGCEASEPIT